MKVRVKLGRESQSIDFGDRDASIITLGELLQLVTSQFHLENSEFHLSLNKNDALTGDDRILGDIGIISGDLIHIIGPNIPQGNPSRHSEQVRNRAQALASYSSSDYAYSPENGQNGPSRSGSSNAPQSSVSAVSVKSASVQAGRIDSDMDVSEATQGREGRAGNAGAGPDIGQDVNRYLVEPLTVRESSANMVPALLDQLFSAASCTCATDALWVVIHTLVLESGFLPTGTQDPTRMPDNWKHPGFYSCSYDYTVSPDSVRGCIVVGVTMGTSVTVHALSTSNPNFKTEHLQLKAADFVRTLSQNVPDIYRALDRLSRQVKDSICLPLVSELVTDAGFVQRQGLMALPYEVKQRILTFLDARSLCHMGQVCQEFSAMYRDKLLWRLLFIRDFERPEDSSLGRPWFEMYRERCIFERQYRAQRRIVIEPEPPWGFPGPFHPGFHFPPRLLGGDYDLNPEFAAGIPNSMGSGRRPDILPTMPNPLRPRHSGLELPGRLYPGRGNMTGSPFSNPFRGPFI